MKLSDIDFSKRFTIIFGITSDKIDVVDELRMYSNTEGITLNVFPEIDTNDGYGFLFHPKMQVKYAKNIGKQEKIIILTNSDYIIKEINTLIQLRTRNDERITKELGYEGIEQIDYNDVSAYDVSGDELVKCEVTHNAIWVESIDEVINNMTETQNCILYSN